MDNKNAISKEVINLQKVDERQLTIEHKLDELIILLAESQLNSDSIKKIQNRFNNAVEFSMINKEQVDEFRKVTDAKEKKSREEMLDQFSVLLVNTKFDSKVSSAFIRKERISAVILFFTGAAMITLGWAMIVMPQPPYFEMFTIYYFTTDDGITLMDLISLCIILAGAYIMIRAFYKKVFQDKKWQPAKV